MDGGGEENGPPPCLMVVAVRGGRWTWWRSHCCFAQVVVVPLLGSLCAAPGGRLEADRRTDGRTDGGGGAEEPLSLFPSSCSFVFVRRVMFLSAAGRERFLVGDSTTF